MIFEDKFRLYMIYIYMHKVHLIEYMGYEYLMQVCGKMHAWYGSTLWIHGCYAYMLRNAISICGYIYMYIYIYT